MKTLKFTHVQNFVFYDSFVAETILFVRVFEKWEPDLVYTFLNVVMLFYISVHIARGCFVVLYTSSIFFSKLLLAWFYISPLFFVSFTTAFPCAFLSAFNLSLFFQARLALFAVLLSFCFKPIFTLGAVTACRHFC